MFFVIAHNILFVIFSNLSPSLLLTSAQLTAISLVRRGSVLVLMFVNVPPGELITLFRVNFLDVLDVSRDCINSSLSLMSIIFAVQLGWSYL